MLFIIAKINEHKIAEIGIHNQRICNEKGEMLYKIYVLVNERTRKEKWDYKGIIYHKRNTGWKKLTLKVLTLLEEQDNERSKKNRRSNKKD